jgi:hypothetical protein
MNTTVSELNAITNAKREQRLANGEKQKQKRKQPAPLRGQLRCEGCGATVDAACPCGMPYAYVPAGEAAAKAIEANPEMSNNAIAKDIGVSEPTVRRIRGSLKDEPGGTKRKGKDGKTYPATNPKRQKSTKGPDEQQYLDRVEKAVALAKKPFTGMLTKEVINLARGVAAAWTEAADKLERQLRTLK